LAAQQKKRPCVFAKRQIPKHPNTIAGLVRHLTTVIQRIAKDLTGTPLGYRNGRTRRALEFAIDDRARVLDALKNASPVLHQKLVRELGMVQNS